jgi:hypothetical protein
MNRTLQAAPVKTYHDQTHQYLQTHLEALLMADNFGRRLNQLSGLPLYEYICHCRQKAPERLTVKQRHHALGRNT